MRIAIALVLALCTFVVNAAPARRGPDTESNQPVEAEESHPKGTDDVDNNPEENNSTESDDGQLWQRNGTDTESNQPVEAEESHPKGTVDVDNNPEENNSTESGDGPLWQRSGKFEGDMVISPKSTNRNGDPNGSRRWPGRILPYAFASGHFTSEQQQFIMGALTQFDSSCLRVQPWRGEPNYVIITRYGTGCHSDIGYMNKGQQQLNLQNNNDGSCLSTGTVVHEFLHAAGFFHQQSATERDTYVAIDYSNVESDKRHNFDIYNTLNFGVAYDFGSVMHYNNYAFAIDRNRPTIWVKTNPSIRLGNDVRMTQSDLLKLNRMYGC